MHTVTAYPTRNFARWNLLFTLELLFDAAFMIKSIISFACTIIYNLSTTSTETFLFDQFSSLCHKVYIYDIELILLKPQYFQNNDYDLNHTNKLRELFEMNFIGDE